MHRRIERTGTKRDLVPQVGGTTDNRTTERKLLYKDHTAESHCGGVYENIYAYLVFSPLSPQALPRLSRSPLSPPADEHVVRCTCDQSATRSCRDARPCVASASGDLVAGGPTRCAGSRRDLQNSASRPTSATEKSSIVQTRARSAHLRAKFRRMEGRPGRAPVIDNV